MTITILTPLDLSDARKVGKHRYRKQILPLGSIMYEGQKINFDRQFHIDLAKSFKLGAYDQVPFVLANAKNEHHMDPKLFEGDIVGLEMTDDGLDAVLDLTPEGAALIEKNPRLGVSARIVQGLSKHGRTYKLALQHVLATLDPRVTGMRPWQAINLSVYHNSEVVDLTAETYEGRVKQMPKAQSKITLNSVDAKTKLATLDLSKLSDDEFEAMLDLAQADGEVEIDPATGKPVLPAKPGEEVEVVPEDLEEDGEDEIDPDQPNEQHAAVTAAPAGGAPSGGKVIKRKTTVEEEASQPPAVVAELSNRMSAFERKQAADAWANRRELLASKGVPPFALDLAEPILSDPTTMIIDLSAAGGAKHDPKSVIDKLLDGYVGAIDLSPEMGHAIELSHKTGDADPDKAMLDAWNDQYGG